MTLLSMHFQDAYYAGKNYALQDTYEAEREPRAGLIHRVVLARLHSREAFAGRAPRGCHAAAPRCPPLRIAPHPLGPSTTSSRGPAGPGQGARTRTPIRSPRFLQTASTVSNATVRPGVLIQPVAADARPASPVLWPVPVSDSVVLPPLPHPAAPYRPLGRHESWLGSDEEEPFLLTRALLAATRGPLAPSLPYPAMRKTLWPHLVRPRRC